MQEDTISINHNWTNAFGIERVWQHLNSELRMVSSVTCVKYTHTGICPGEEKWEELEFIKWDGHLAH